MPSQKRICFVTGTRAEYGLLADLMRRVAVDSSLALQIIATGTHLSVDFGDTYNEIEDDGFFIDEKIDIDLRTDDAVGVTRSMGLAIEGFGRAYNKLKPDMIVLLGDRYEIFCAASAALIARVPVSHIHGGEVTEGAFDDALRHSITKLSHVHFTATERYRERVIQLGEQPSAVFNYGAIGIDNITNVPLGSKCKLKQEFGLDFEKPTFLVTFHPPTLDSVPVKRQIQSLLSVIAEFDKMNFIFTKANADPGGREINNCISDFSKRHPRNTIFRDSLGSSLYLSVMRGAVGVVGNSSSGLIEAPSFKIGSINIGDRQKGRIKSDSVIDCEPSEESIREAFVLLLSPDFQNRLKSITNPYGDGGTGDRIFTTIKSMELNGLLKKSFYDTTV